MTSASVKKSDLEKRLRKDLETCMRTKSLIEANTIRMLLSDLHNESIHKKRDLTIEEEFSVISRQKKRYNQSIDAFLKADRSDLAEKERFQLDIVNRYAPKNFTTEEATQIISSVIQELDATPADFGKVMGLAMSQLKNRFPGKEASNLVKQLLTK